MNSPTRHPGLLRLPPELLQAIFKNCPESNSNLLCVCRYVRSQAEPLFYQTIVLGWDQRNGSNVKKLPQLLRMLLSRPQHAVYVQRLELWGPKFHNAWEREDDCPILDAEFHRLSVWTRKLFPSVAAHFAKGLRTGRVHAIIAVILTLLPNLQTLLLDQETGCFLEKNLINTVFKYAPTIKDHALSRLKTFEIEAKDFGDGNYKYPANSITIDVVPIFGLPTIRSLKLNDITIKAPPQAEASPSSVTSLEISGMLDNAIEGLLSHTPRLETLRYYYRGDVEPCPCEDCTGKTTHFICVNLMAGLQYSRGTLRELVIFNSRPIPDRIGIGDPGPFSVNGQLGSLQGFSQLTRLEVTGRMLLGYSHRNNKVLANILPKNLVCLHLLDLRGPYTWTWTIADVISALTVYVWLVTAESRPLQHVVLDDTGKHLQGFGMALRALSTPTLHVEVASWWYDSCFTGPYCV